MFVIVDAESDKFAAIVVAVAIVKVVVFAATFDVIIINEFFVVSITVAVFAATRVVLTAAVAVMGGSAIDVVIEGDSVGMLLGIQIY